MCLDRSLWNFKWSWMTLASHKLSSRQVTWISTKSYKEIFVFLGLFELLVSKGVFRKMKMSFKNLKEVFSKNITRNKNIFQFSPRCYQSGDSNFFLGPIFRFLNFSCFIHDVKMQIPDNWSWFSKHRERFFL